MVIHLFRQRPATLFPQSYYSLQRDRALSRQVNRVRLARRSVRSPLPFATAGRRQQLPTDCREDIVSEDIIRICPPPAGETEIALRLRI